MPKAGKDSQEKLEFKFANTQDRRLNMKPIITKLAGVTFGDAQKNIKLFGCKDINSYALVREPNNPHDPNAIRVALFRRLFLGYVPKAIARELAPEMDAGKRFLAFFVKRNEHPRHKWVGLEVRIEQVPGEEAA